MDSPPLPVPVGSPPGSDSRWNSGALQLTAQLRVEALAETRAVHRELGRPLPSHTLSARTLHHEVLDDAVEDGVVIVALNAQLAKGGGGKEGLGPARQCGASGLTRCHRTRQQTARCHSSCALGTPGTGKTCGRHQQRHSSVAAAHITARHPVSASAPAQSCGWPWVPPWATAQCPDRPAWSSAPPAAVKGQGEGL